MAVGMTPNENLRARTGSNMPPPESWAPQPTAPAVEDIPLDELRLRRLVGDEIEQVIPMRSQIDLTAAMLADPAFAEHEKKKTD